MVLKRLSVVEYFCTPGLQLQCQSGAAPEMTGKAFDLAAILPKMMRRNYLDRPPLISMNSAKECKAQCEWGYSAELPFFLFNGPNALLLNVGMNPVRNRTTRKDPYLDQNVKAGRDLSLPVCWIWMRLENGHKVQCCTVGFSIRGMAISPNPAHDEIDIQPWRKTMSLVDIQLFDAFTASVVFKADSSSGPVMTKFWKLEQLANIYFDQWCSRCDRASVWNKIQFQTAIEISWEALKWSFEVCNFMR